MNFLAIINRVRTNCDVSGPALTTAQNLSGESLNIANWVNEAWLDIQAQRTDWEWLRKTATFPTVSGQPLYTTAQIGLTDFGMWARDTFRNYANPTVTFSIASPCVMMLQSHNLTVGQTVKPYTTGALPTGLVAGTTYYVQSVLSADTVTLAAASGGVAINTSGSQSGTHTITSNNALTFAGLSSEVFMEYLDYDAWRDGYEYGALRQTQTRPMVLTIAPDKSIGLGPFPIAGYTILGDYYSVPSEMVADADIPALPSKFHLAIVYRAMMAYGQYESAPEVFNRGATEFSKWMRRVYADQLPEITVPGALC